jgi:hypothetical protein
LNALMEAALLEQQLVASTEQRKRSWKKDETV